MITPNTIPSSNKFWTIVILTISVLLLGAYLYSWNKQSKELKTLNEVHSTDQMLNDSLTRENLMLSSHRALTQMMQYRDDASKWSNIPETGSIVVVKPGMDTAVVAGIVAGGTKYEYFIKAKIRYKHGAEEIIDPTLINILK